MNKEILMSKANDSTNNYPFYSALSITVGFSSQSSSLGLNRSNEQLIGYYSEQSNVSLRFNNHEYIGDITRKDLFSTILTIQTLSNGRVGRSNHVEIFKNKISDILPQAKEKTLYIKRLDTNTIAESTECEEYTETLRYVIYQTLFFLAEDENKHISLEIYME